MTNSNLANQTITFDEKGNPSPYTLINQNIEDFCNIFLFNETRENIYICFEQYSADLKAILGEHSFEQWVNGSFTTQKVAPNDIDVLSIVPHTSLPGKTHLFFKFTPQAGVKSQYEDKVDAYLVYKYPENDKRYELTKEFLDHFTRSWGADRDGNPKGIIYLKR